MEENDKEKKVEINMTHFPTIAQQNCSRETDEPNFPHSLDNGNGTKSKV